MKLRQVLFAALAAALIVASPTLAQLVTRGMPSAPTPLTGIETVAIDTNLASGQSPQTGKLTSIQWAGRAQTALTDAATITPSGTAGNFFTVTLAGNRTIANLSPAPAPNSNFSILVRQDSVGSRTVTWGALFNWIGSSAPTLTTTATRADIINCYYESTISGYYMCDKQLSMK
jgi:hypothetical protein